MNPFAPFSQNPKAPHKSHLLGVLSLGLIVFGAGPSFAESQRIPQPSQPIKSRFDYNFAFQHDRGPVSSIDLGLGYGAIYAPSQNGGNTTQNKKIVSGATLLFLGSVGWTILPNLSVEASSFGMVASGNGLIAAGLTTRYWFHDSPWSVALSLGPSTFKVTSLKQNYFSNLYSAMQLNIGLSTWLSENTYASVKLTGGVAGLGLYQSIGLSTWWAGGTLSFGIN